MPNRLRRFRRERNMTLAQVANALGTTPQTVSRLENDVMTVSVDWLERFARLFEVAPADLLESPGAQALTFLGLADASGRIRRASNRDDPVGGFDLALPPGADLAVRLKARQGPFGPGDVLIAKRLEQADWEQADWAQAEGDHGALVALDSETILLRRLIPDPPGRAILVPLEAGQDVTRVETPDWVARIVMRVSYL